MPATSSSVGSGAAGAAIFADSDSRKYRYFDPKGAARHPLRGHDGRRPARSRALPDPGLDHLVRRRQAAPTSRTTPPPRAPTGTLFRAPDQEWERTHYQRQSKIETMVQSVIDNARKSGAPKTFDKAWVKMLQTHLGAWKHAEFGLGTSLMQAQRYGYTQMINNAMLTNSSYKLRLAQDITLYLAEIGMDIAGWDDEARQEGLAGGRDLAGHARGGRDHHGLDRLSRAVFRHQHRVRAAGRRAVPLRLPDAGRGRQPRLHHARR